MHGAVRFFLFLSLTIWAFIGCTGSRDLLKSIPPTVGTVKSADRYIKQIAVALTRAPATAVGQVAAKRYLDTLMSAIRDENQRLNLIKPGDEKYPEFMAALAEGDAVSIDAVALSQQGRQAGYQGLMVASLTDIRPVAKKTGVLWLRKTRHFVQYTMTVDLYNPYTAAKMISEVIEGSIKISQHDYDGIQSGTVMQIEELNGTIEDVGQDYGQRIGEALKDHQWLASVAKIEGERIFLSVGSPAGLSKGDRLAVFEGRQVIESIHEGRFIVPGLKIGEIEVITGDGEMTEARALNGDAIRQGDIVVPIQ